jgi:hypothetical protein
MTLEEMTAQRDVLLAARYRGVRTVEMAGRMPPMPSRIGRATWSAPASSRPR